MDNIHSRKTKQNKMHSEVERARARGVPFLFGSVIYIIPDRVRGEIKLSSGFVQDLMERDRGRKHPLGVEKY